jgi:hypothetical protein
MDITQKMYHIAPTVLRDKIAREGLLSQPVSDRWGSKAKGQPDGLYVFSDVTTARMFRACYGGDVWAVDGEGAQTDTRFGYPDSYYLPTSRPATLFHKAEDLDGKCWRCTIEPTGVDPHGIPLSVCLSCAALA